MATHAQNSYLPEHVIRYWYGGSDDDLEQIRAQGKIWYSFAPERDDEIRQNFGTLLEEIVTGQRENWTDSSTGVLALVLVLDQFTRQIYRKQAKAFAFDAQALDIAYAAIGRGLDQELSVASRLFLYHPFQHSEKLKDQEFGVQMVRNLLSHCDPEWEDYVGQSLRYFEEHCAVIRRFGRFPHRNHVLERESTPDEVEYLKTASRYGQ